VNIDGGAIDGAVIGANSAVAGSFTTISSAGQATLASVDINGGAIDGATIGANSASPITGTTITGTSLVGPVTGNLTGNSSGTHTGPVTGAVTGNLTGNITSSGTSTFNNVTIDGTLNMNAGTSATITNLSAPTNDNDAARKVDVDNAVANLVDSAPGTLDTLNELAAALGDDPDFATTITNSIATKLPLAGGTMTGAIAMSTNKITGVGDPTAAQDVSSKAYTDQQDALQVTKSGDSMSGNLAMGSNNITGLATPTANDHAVNKSYADNILGSSTAAATSASNAATSASNAATSETNASNSAAAALTSKNAAATSLATFQNQYLGAQGSAPTADPDGSALDVGDLYFDTTAGAMKVYSANGWTNAGSSVNGTTNRYSYTATTGQTVFAATYDAGYVDVFLNGVKQVIGSTKDVTATTGTSIVFNSATSANDVVDIIGYGTFVLADHLTQTQSDARYVNLSGDTMTGNLDITGTLTSDGLTVGGSTNNAQYADLSSSGLRSLRLSSFANNGNDNAGHDINASSSLGAVTLSTGGNTRFKADSNGDIRFYEDTGTTPKFFWDASDERLVLGTTENNPVASLAVKTDINGRAIHIEENSGGESYQIGVDADGGLGFYNSGLTTASVTFDDSGNVGVGGNPTVLGGQNYVTVHSPGSSTNIAGYDLYVSGTREASLISYPSNSEALRIAGLTNRPVTFHANNSEVMRLSSAGELLVGNTSTILDAEENAEQGVDIRPEGFVKISRSSNHPLQLARTNDGNLVKFRSNEVTVGSIGTQSSQLSLTASSNELFVGSRGANQAYFDVSTGVAFSAFSSFNGTADLGRSNARFKDLYLSGGVDFGGSVNSGGVVSTSNKLDDYEEGSWSPGTSSGTISAINAKYTKIGRSVTVSALIYNISDQSSSNVFTITNLPFASCGSCRSVGAIMMRYQSNTSLTAAYITQNTSNVEFYGVTAGGWDVAIHSDWNNINSEVYFTVTYNAD
jgi:hypothetical protein